LAIPFPIVDVSSLPEGERGAVAIRLTNEESRQPLDLASGPLLRGKLLRVSQNESVVLSTMHHIVSDGWSTGIFIREMRTLYNIFSQGEPTPLPELLIQYADFAVWQRQWLRGEVIERHLAYWRKQLSGSLSALNLPTDRPRPVAPTHRGAGHSFILSPSLSKSLRQLSRQERVTPFMLMVAALKTLLYRYTGQTDIILGVDIANRNRAEIEDLIGFFVNILVWRTNLSDDPSFRELLRRVREVGLDAYSYQDLPYEKLVEELRPERTPDQSPLFQVLFAYQNTPRQKLKLPEVELHPRKGARVIARFDLTLMMFETEESFVGTWRYSTDLFDAATIARMSGNFETLLASASNQPDLPLSGLEMLREFEREHQAKEKQERRDAEISELKSARRKVVDLKKMSLIK
jgi:hypothetical protein